MKLSKWIASQSAIFMIEKTPIIIFFILCCFIFCPNELKMKISMGFRIPKILPISKHLTTSFYQA